MKQTKLTKGKKKKTGLCTDLKQNKQVCTSYICDECGVALCIGQCWEKNNTKKTIILSNSQKYFGYFTEPSAVCVNKALYKNFTYATEIKN